MLRSLILLMICSGWVVSSSQTVGFDSGSLGLQPCTNFRGEQGIVCEEGDDIQCITTHLWCRDDIVKTCDVFGGVGQILTNYSELCGDTLFWRNKTCDIFRSDGEKLALGFRCTGGQQHCINPWYLRLTPDVDYDTILKVRKRLIIYQSA